MNTTTTIYIPRVVATHTVQSISQIMNTYGVGVVRRVDFVPIVDNDAFIQAFVHMNTMFLTNITDHMLYKFSQDKGYKLSFGPKDYWILLKAKNPVPDTRLNVHQLAENHTILQNVVSVGFDDIYAKYKEQQSVIMKQSQQIERLQETIYQILGKVYDQETESGRSYIFAFFNWMKYGKMYDKGWLDEDDNVPEESQSLSDQIHSPTSQHDDYDVMRQLIHSSLYDDNESDDDVPSLISPSLISSSNSSYADTSY